VATLDRLIVAAEELIAEGGTGVSLRAINARAGANVAAAHYHFGSKEDLVRAVLEHRMTEIEDQRRELLVPYQDLERPPLRPVVSAFVLPLARLTLDEGSQYVGFLAALQRGGWRWRKIAQETFGAHGNQINSMLDRALPDIPADIRRFRRRVYLTTAVDALADHGEPQAGEDWTGEVLVGAIIDGIVGALTAPTGDLTWDFQSIT
jgi:AcrR family transcriptional regulator